MRTKKQINYKELKAAYIPKPNGNDYESELNKTPCMSLEPDPDGKLGLSDDCKQFIKYYCNFKNLQYVAGLMGTTAEDLSISYMSKQVVIDEISRINTAMYHRMFAAKQASLDNIASYLTCMMTDNGVPIGDRLSSSEKVGVARLLIDLNKYKEESYKNIDMIDTADVEQQLKQLSTDSIKELLYVKTNSDVIAAQKKTKEEIISKLESCNKKDADSVQKFSPIEKETLMAMPIEELLKMLNSYNSKK